MERYKEYVRNFTGLRRLAPTFFLIAKINLQPLGTRKRISAAANCCPPLGGDCWVFGFVFLGLWVFLFWCLGFFGFGLGFFCVVPVGRFRSAVRLPELPPPLPALPCGLRAPGTLQKLRAILQPPGSRLPPPPLPSPRAPPYFRNRRNLHRSPAPGRAGERRGSRTSPTRPRCGPPAPPAQPIPSRGFSAGLLCGNAAGGGLCCGHRAALARVIPSCTDSPPSHEYPPRICTPRRGEPPPMPCCKAPLLHG